MPFAANCLAKSGEFQHQTHDCDRFRGFGLLGLLLLGLLPLALFGGLGGGDDPVVQDDPLTGDDSVPGSGGVDIFNPGTGGFGSGASSTGGNSGGGTSLALGDVEFATESNDTLTGGVFDDLLAGMGGDDSLRGGRGEDFLVGFTGNDFLKGEADGDVLVGGAGNDTLWGQDNDDAMFGNGGNDLLVGGNGNDGLADASGSDTLRGGNGDDMLTAIEQTDKITQADLLPVSGAGLSDAEFRTVVTTTFGSDRVSADQMTFLFAEVRGGERTIDTPDVLDGGAGNDILLGDDGDTMTGGTGNDLFSVYADPAQAANSDAVTITDLDPARDRLLISVEDDANGLVSLAADPAGLGTQVLYRGDVVALVSGKSPADLKGFLSQIIFTKRVDV